MISFQFYLFYVCAIAFNYILPEIWFDNNLSLSWKQRNAYIFKKYEFSPVHIVSPLAVSKSFPYNLDIKSQTKVCVPCDLYRTLTSNGQFIYVLVIEGNSFNCVLFSLSLRSKIKRPGFVLSNLLICQLFGSTPVHCLVMTQDFYLRWAPLCNL